ncbi:MAG TPA: YbhB/YbcL family Raf kinase inhibitor-like protein [Chitinophagales bacterium]|nr:YbhB/YbcL family Raf kinase inhibitor-like protein [Chitinophagales bacterium]
MKMPILIAILCAATTIHAQTFTLKSSQIGGQATCELISNRYGCDGLNLSPQLTWENAPPETKSFAVTVFDESAPTGSGWWHWIIFNIPDSVSSLKEGAGDLSLQLAPAGSIQSTTALQRQGYGGPCPPQGDGFHKYVVTVYALKTPDLELPPTALPATVAYLIEQNVIEKSSLIFYYKR